ncbi:MAG: hypothetical protein ABJC13_03225 [Acidobacteriota bacterium]
MKWRSWFFGLVALSVALLASWLSTKETVRPLYSFFDGTGTVIGWFLSCLTVLVGVAAWFERAALRRWLLNRQFPQVGDDVRDWRSRVEALVIPVSPRREQPEWLIRHLKPSHVSFLYTSESRATAAGLARDFGSESLEFSPSYHQIVAAANELKDPNDTREARTQTKLFLERFDRLGIPPSRVFVDTTAGKVPTSIGAFQAAEEAAVATIYIVGTKNGLIQDPGDASHGQPKFVSNPLARSEDLPEARRRP